MCCTKPDFVHLRSERRLLRSSFFLASFFSYATSTFFLSVFFISSGPRLRERKKERKKDRKIVHRPYRERHTWALAPVAGASAGEISDRVQSWVQWVV
jgi:hypothetical protein